MKAVFEARRSGSLRPWMLPGFIAGCLIAVTTSQGQQSRAPAENQPADGAVGGQNATLRIFRLEHANAERIQEVLKQILELRDTGPRQRGRGSVAADSRTNSVVVQAAGDSMEIITNTIRALDVPMADPIGNPREVRIFTPQNLVLDESVQQQLRVVISDEGRIAVDPVRNAVVAQDSNDALAALEALLIRLDETSATSASSGLRVRISWLIGGMDGKDLQPLPADLEKVAGDLAKIGVDNLKLAAQAVVHTVANDQFELKCWPELDTTCELTASGSFLQKPGARTALSIQISARRTAPDTHPLCELNTTIIAPLDQIVVLGSAPAGKMTSVIVVQVTSDP